MQIAAKTKRRTPDSTIHPKIIKASKINKRTPSNFSIKEKANGRRIHKRNKIFEEDDK